MPGMWKGQNLFSMILMFSMYPFLIMFLLMPQYMAYLIAGMCVYFAVFFFIRTSILLKKREQIDGVLWLDSWTIRDLDYSEELLWGIEHAKLIEYRLGDSQSSLEECLKEAEEILKENPEYKKKDKDKKPEANDKDKEIIDLAKTFTKDQLRGRYYYLVKLSQETSFNDTQKHTFKKAIFITRFPFWIEFNPDRLELEVEGYFAKGRAAKCALNIESWLTDDRPLVTVAWTEASTLEIKAKLEKPTDIEAELEDRIKNVINGLRDLVDHYEAKTERLQITEDKWRKRAEGFQELYEDSEQWWEYVKDDYFNQNASEKKNVVKMKKGYAIALMIAMVVLLSLVFGLGR